MRFDELPLAAPLLRAVAEEGYETATPIQAQAIPPILEHRDVMGCAQTGTGKTAAFALPILHNLFADKPSLAQPGAQDPQAKPGKRSKRPKLPRCLVVAPTRELATQIAEGFQAYGKHLPVRGACIYGGVGQRPQVAKLERGIDILIATPGRLLDLINQGHAHLRAIETLVLDEADRMLDMGFINDIRKIVSYVPEQRQTLMFSATMAPPIRKLAQALLRDPVSISIAPKQPAAERIEQVVHFVQRAEKPDLLARLMQTQPMHRVIVFTRTKHGADRVVRQLRQRGIHGEAIHGNKSQNARQRSLNNFKQDKIGVLVATDIAARGIDVESVTHVVNFDLTHEPETYVHRIGRTARAGEEGVAISFCDQDEVAHLRAIESLLGQPLTIQGPTPDYAHSQPAGKRNKRPRHPLAGKQTAPGKQGKPGKGKRQAQPGKGKAAQPNTPAGKRPRRRRTGKSHPGAA